MKTKCKRNEEIMLQWIKQKSADAFNLERGKDVSMS